MFEYGNIRRHLMEVPVFPKLRSIKVFLYAGNESEFLEHPRTAGSDGMR